jgi:acetyl esterase/lipase
MMGFSAGGEVVSMVAYSPTAGDAAAVDPIDRASCRPDFQVMIYPGPLGIPETLPADTPPAFLLVANDDRGAAGVVASLFQKMRSCKVPVECHVLAKGGHAFNMGTRSQLASIKGWPVRLADWLTDNFLSTTTPAK